MSIPRILVLATALLGTGAAMAQSSSEAQALSRAEVLADLEIYQRSGLGAIEQDDLQMFRGERYRAALARYRALRQSPEFAVRVQAIAQRRGETLTATAP
ncbi:DUF4148 domain-containing protein [Inhella proteolytica]|uniref:DUF4148 domain-containing protein n=1 Tax=Inhella proteolytica TaxID=2795029 RepID=A0A931NHX6_9BURK|nr:DUF4148 domain-containing protein [Inhella proteolytica]MBH9576980.1 DUF4148 domain-containing protein [Inhella proteolytica]